MVEFPDKRIYLYYEHIDFRKGIKGLTNIVTTELSDTDLYDSLYLFFSKDRRQVKILEIEKDNIWLYQNKLIGYRFVFPRSDKSIKISYTELKLILKTVELVAHRSNK